MKNIRKITLSAMFLAIGAVLPFLTGQLKEIGDTLLPMHIPVMLCGLICGSGYGGTVGLILPFLRAVTFGMPPVYPNAVWMSLELATYGFVIGFLYVSFQKKQLWWLYCSLVSAMCAGRVVWGISKAVLLGISGKAFTVQAFVAGGFVDAIPGIVLQLVLIPVIIRLKDTVLERLKKS
ncbi:MAG: ECF transporter S component [Oscillospiraceae bacterium]|nr:ECF transporter S component [Oscillospiraceae bacterium]